MELKLKDLLTAITFKPFADMKDIWVEVALEDGTYTLCYGVEYAVEQWGDRDVAACEVKGYNHITVWIKDRIYNK